MGRAQVAQAEAAGMDNLAKNMAVGALTVIIWDYLPLINGGTIYAATGLYSLIVGFILGLVVNVVVSLVTKKPSKEIVKEFESIKTLEI